jgi:uncharacterized protein with PQ loop repeat
MPSSAVIANLFGTLGSVSWSIQLLPQIYLNYRRHSTEGLSSTFMLFWILAGLPLGIYNIVSKLNIALQIQPQILTTLSLITWGQCYYYQRKWPLLRVVGIVLLLDMALGGVETGLVFALRCAKERGVHWPVQMMAGLAGLLLALGVAEQYLAILRHKSVEGISFLFCGIDALGDITSIVSVLFEPHLQVVGLVAYSVELALWMGVFTLGGYYKFLPWLKMRLIAMRRRRCAENAPETPAGSNRIALHDLPSSTSVFRTPSAEHEVRSRLPRAG